jgi:3-methyladenine DNA glycosylase AlkD
MKTIEKIKKDLRASSDASKAKVMQRFFKTGKGQYGEGDIFLGVTVPESRRIARLYHSCDLETVSELLRSKVHEERLVALLILVHKYRSGEKGIFEFYVRHMKNVNNWDLVDLSAPSIVGAHLADANRSLLYRLAGSANIWERRIAIVATHYFIRNNDFADALKIARMLLGDRHDLIHKASGWMLREVGNRDAAALERFLDSHSAKMPRTMLRYAIEKLPERKRKLFLARESR